MNFGRFILISFFSVSILVNYSVAVLACGGPSTQIAIGMTDPLYGKPIDRLTFRFKFNNQVESLKVEDDDGVISLMALSVLQVNMTREELDQKWKKSYLALLKKTKDYHSTHIKNNDNATDPQVVSNWKTVRNYYSDYLDFVSSILEEAGQDLNAQIPHETFGKLIQKIRKISFALGYLVDDGKKSYGQLSIFNSHTNQNALNENMNQYFKIADFQDFLNLEESGKDFVKFRGSSCNTEFAPM